MTGGHVDLVRRATALFDEVVVGVAIHASKAPLFSLDDRLALLRASLEGTTVTPIEGLVVDACRKHGCGTLLRGVRGPGDLDYELRMARTNAELADVETVFLGATPRWGHVSSTLVRQIATMGGDVTPFVPPAVVELLAQRQA